MVQVENIKNFTECFRNISPTNKVKKRDYHSEGTVPIIDQGEDFIGGYTSDSAMIQNVELPVILFGDHTRRFKFVNSKFAVGADGVKILKVNSDLLDEKFAFYQLLQAKFPDKGYSRHYQYLKKVSFWAPENKKIQTKTVDVIETQFTRLDAAIKSLKTIKTKLETYRQSVLKAAFENMVKKHEPLKDHVELISGQHIMKHDYNFSRKGVPYLTGPADFTSKHPAITKWTSKPKAVAFKGDVLITVKGSGVGKVNILSEQKAAISRQLMALRSSGFEPDYIYWYMKHKFDLISKLSTGTAIPGIGRESILTFNFPVTDEAHQRSIVLEIESRFSVIDMVQEVVDNTLLKADRLRKSILKSAFEGKLVE